MARNLPFLTIVTLGLAAVSGCQQSSSMVDNLPAPNFNGPVIAPQVAVAPPRVTAPVAKPVQPVALRGERAWAINVAPRQWKYIVIHHSATPSGNAAKFNKEHQEKGWDELGYHFVIGNGTDSSNGQVEVGPRWPKQKWGAHAKTPDNRFNDYGIGICLVGNFQIERPTKQQLDSLARLVSYLMQTYKIPASNVVGHRDTKPTECPGSNLDVMLVRSMARQRFADAGLAIDDAQTASATEILEQLVPGTELLRGN